MLIYPIVGTGLAFFILLLLWSLVEICRPIGQEGKRMVESEVGEMKMHGVSEEKLEIVSVFHCSPVSKIVTCRISRSPSSWRSTGTWTGMQSS